MGVEINTLSKRLGLIMALLFYCRIAAASYDPAIINPLKSCRCAIIITTDQILH
jgi:hypothetical protein